MEKFNNFKNAKASKLNAKLTEDQKRACDKILEFLNDPNPPTLAIGLCGAGGTGKTFLIKYILELSGYANSVIGLAAPTHKAVRVLAQATGRKVNTIQSDLGLRLNVDVDNFDINNPPFDPLAEKKIQGYKLYVVDEASMIGRNLKILIERECKAHGCRIIYMGDSCQLPPVNERTSSCFTGIPVFTLNEIVRQDASNPIAYTLKLLRYDIKHRTYKFLEEVNRNRVRFNDIGTLGYYTCCKDEFASLVLKGFNSDEFTSNVDECRLICYTNKAVSTWNSYIRNNLIEDANRSVLTRNDLVLCYTTMLDEFGETIITNSEDYIIKDVTNYTNSDGIKGFLVRFIAIYGGKPTKPLFVVDHSDYNNVAIYYKIANTLIESAKSADKYNRSKRWKEYYAFKERNLLLTNILDNTGKIKFSRDLDYGFALTSHKSQGSTFNDVYIDINDIVFQADGRTPYSNIDELLRRLYVAVSRCRSRVFMAYG